MSDAPPRLAVRALILQRDRLLLVNAYPGHDSDLWCAPGGGVARHSSLPANLTREVAEETGLKIAVGPLVLVNEFHDPDIDLHQVDLFFRCRVVSGALDSGSDPEGIVNRHRWVGRDELPTLRHKPDALGHAACGTEAGGDTGGNTGTDMGGGAPPGAIYDPLERLVR